MAATSPSRSNTPDGQHDYDVTHMREDDFERLAVYIVPDVPCERGTISRAEKTLPRSLTLKPSLVLSTPNVKVFYHNQLDLFSCELSIFIHSHSYVWIELFNHILFFDSIFSQKD